ncbi:sporulation protein YlmC with PRC-barrel domain [Rhizomicrobium palustre]|uniref:Sporulation protein YlmC with PRC-barrel domain n=1 Tax=Rhizomicrobium palustre TaxID=189966 RepID=A0A846MUB8_9PROT|nr:PRC-barrel domain-containing protein [Rhizomicrobium palustre]NIK86801.1 sporulation protein YlmC with PRC-barrel domain [Rhizomicrobium palustre]
MFARPLPVSFAFFLSLAAPAAAQPVSTPAEQTQTQQLNQNITDANRAADAKKAENNALYQQQQARYQEQLTVYKAGQKNYQERAAIYLAARDRYIAGHAQYQRATWPARYQQSLIVDTNDLLGARVRTSNGRTVGQVAEIALLDGRVDALRVTLDNRRGDVWVDSGDLRFDADKKVVMTNLNRRDLYIMTQETY